MDRGQKITVCSPSPVARRGRTKGVGQKKTAIRSPSPVVRRGRSKGVGQKKTAIHSLSPVVRRGRSKGVGQKKTADRAHGRSVEIYWGERERAPHQRVGWWKFSVTIIQPYVVLKHFACVVKCSGWQTKG